ncbi:unnamed protein product [Arctia plantaginis]|uniref:Uncharacterized protein n=1 Tax=Arctia plantaginis TaxID=874455 RepID=A0A8S1AT69_ARCPL|nr:unnamed protein product [Arctia plantaginis]
MLLVRELALIAAYMFLYSNSQQDKHNNQTQFKPKPFSQNPNTSNKFQQKPMSQSNSANHGRRFKDGTYLKKVNPFNPKVTKVLVTPKEVIHQGNQPQNFNLDPKVTKVLVTPKEVIHQGNQPQNGNLNPKVTKVLVTPKEVIHQGNQPQNGNLDPKVTKVNQPQNGNLNPKVTKVFITPKEVIHQGNQPQNGNLDPKVTKVLVTPKEVIHQGNQPQNGNLDPKNIKASKASDLNEIYEVNIDTSKRLLPHVLVESTASNIPLTLLVDSVNPIQPTSGNTRKLDNQNPGISAEQLEKSLSEPENLDRDLLDLLTSPVSFPSEELNPDVLLECRTPDLDNIQSPGEILQPETPLLPENQAHPLTPEVVILPENPTNPLSLELVLQPETPTQTDFNVILDPTTNDYPTFLKHISDKNRVFNTKIIEYNESLLKTSCKTVIIPTSIDLDESNPYVEEILGTLENREVIFNQEKQLHSNLRKYSFRESNKPKSNSIELEQKIEEIAAPTLRTSF